MIKTARHRCAIFVKKLRLQGTGRSGWSDTVVEISRSIKRYCPMMGSRLRWTELFFKDNAPAGALHTTEIALV